MSPSLQEQLAAAELGRAAAEQRANALADFHGRLSHELRSDLTAILGFSESMLAAGRSATTDDTAKLQAMAHASSHMQGLIEGARAIIALEAGRVAVQPVDVDLDGLLEEAVKAVKPVAGRRGNQVSYTSLAKLGLVSIDLNKVRQVVAALISNANKFTSGGVIDVTSDRVGNASGEWVEITVADTGVGIQPEDIPKVFVEFGVVRPHTRGEKEGARLSLAICRRLCELMGGSISVSSDGSGATFTVKLPYVPAAGI